MKEPIFLIIDLFCGAGGFTEGAEQSGLVEVTTAKAFVAALASPFLKAEKAVA